MKEIAVVVTHPIQYQTPFFRFLTERGLPLHVFFLCDRGVRKSHDPGFGRSIAWDIPLLDGFSHEFLPNFGGTPSPERFLGLANPEVLSKISRKRFSAVLIHGYRNLSLCLAIAAAKGQSIPFLYRSESNLLAGPPTLRTRRLGRLLRAVASACLSIGTANDVFYEAIGIERARRFLVPYSVDNERFAQQARSLTREAACEQLGLPCEKQIVLFAGKLVPWKQPDVLLRAFAKADGGTSHLAFAGDGEMRASLIETASRMGSDKVSFLGFKNQSEIGIAYKSADLLVLPSAHEPWGLVVNEAMNFEVPALVSDRVGCALDLVRPGETGEIFPHNDAVSLEDKLTVLLGNAERLRHMGRTGRERIREWGFEQAERGLRKALAFVGAA